MPEMSVKILNYFVCLYIGTVGLLAVCFATHREVFWDEEGAM